MAALPDPILNDPMHNELLAALPQADLQRVTGHLELVPMPLGKMLCESGAQLQHAYFPTTAVVSLHYLTASGASVEVAGVGNEGMVGVSLYLGGNTTPSAAVVRSAGHAYRLERRRLKDEFEQAGPLQSVLLRYAQGLMTQMSQNAACNRHHSLDQRLCRWLLVALDRDPGGHLVVTQELIANMLGVRREGITEAAGHLRDAGIIHYRRGHLAVLDRVGLEARSCECYAVVRNEMKRLQRVPPP